MKSIYSLKVVNSLGSKWILCLSKRYFMRLGEEGKIEIVKFDTEKGMEIFLKMEGVKSYDKG
jgi:hypothetical protein